MVHCRSWDVSYSKVATAYTVDGRTTNDYSTKQTKEKKNTTDIT